MGRVIVICVVWVLSGVKAVAQDCLDMKARLDRAETKLNDWRHRSERIGQGMLTPSRQD